VIFSKTGYKRPMNHRHMTSWSIQSGRGMHTVPRRFTTAPGYACLLMMWAALAGCNGLTLLTPEEQTAISLGEKVVVLVRVRCTIENDETWQPFHSSALVDNVSLGLGAFDTGGETKQLSGMKFLSPESRGEGWTYLLLQPGTYYLSFYGPQRSTAFAYQRSMKEAPRWRLDVPSDARLVYAGTMHLHGDSEKAIFGGRLLNTLDREKSSLENDEAVATRLLSGYFPDLGQVSVALMRRHEEEPIILRSPLPGP